ncbi:MAG: hypothetical protein ABIO70_10475 [Pseudomonadota bacterium]
MEPSLRFLSLFVPDLPAAAARYAAFLGMAPVLDDPDVPRAHPYAAGPPVVFPLGQVKLALYPCDGRVTHPGDVGIGLVSDDPAALLGRAAQAGAQVFPAHPAAPLRVFMLPDRHFFEVKAG